MDEFTQCLLQLFEQCNYNKPTPIQLRQMRQYYAALVRENSKVNLTAITQPRQAALKHFADSVLPYSVLPRGAHVLDVGSGGGFPAVPLKIMRPDVHMTALEATGKKCAFIKLAAGEADVDVDVIHARAEQLAHEQPRESMDVCVSRAVASLPMLLELCAAFVKPGGLVLAYKTDTQSEREHAQNAQTRLGLKYKKSLQLPVELRHTVLVYKKTQPTYAEYPRPFAKIKKNPL